MTWLSRDLQRFLIALLSPLFAVIGVIAQILCGLETRFGCVRKLNKRANVQVLFRSAANSYVPSRSQRVPLDTGNARFVGTSQAHIPSVSGKIDVPKIDYPVVVPVPVYMVDYYRPSTVCDGPNNSMREQGAASKGAEKVALLARRGECWLVGAASVPLSAANIITGKIGGIASIPGQHPGFRVVADLLAKAVYVGHLMLSHVVSPYVRGQGRALLKQRIRPVLYPRKPALLQAGVVQ